MRPGPRLLMSAEAEGGVEPVTVVVGFAGGEQVAAGIVASGLRVGVDEFGLQGVQPALHRRIVPAANYEDQPARISNSAGQGPGPNTLKQIDQRHPKSLAEGAGHTFEQLQLNVLRRRVTEKVASSR